GGVGGAEPRGSPLSRFLPNAVPVSSESRTTPPSHRWHPGLADGAAPVQGVKDGNPIRAAHRGLAVDREGLRLELGRSSADRRITVAPVIAAPGEKPHYLAIAAHLQSVTIVLDLVHPIRPGRRLGGTGGNAGLDEAVGTERDHAF